MRPSQKYEHHVERSKELSLSGSSAATGFARRGTPHA